MIYVFGKQPVDVSDCATTFDGFFSKDKSQKVILMYDVIYAHCIGKEGVKSENRWMVYNGAPG